MKEWMKKLLLIAITLLVCMLILEVFFRIYWPYKSIYVPDDDMNYKPKGSFEGVYKSPEGQVKFWTNKESFVNQNPSKAKNPGTTRILIVGDSFVEGLYTDKAHHFTTLLQEKLNYSGGKYEVVSFGTSSWGTDNEYKYITLHGLQYSPDAIVITYYQNDLENVAVSRLFKVESGKVVPTSVGGTAVGNKVKKLVTKCSFYSSFCSYFQIHAGGFKFLHPILYKLGFSVGSGNSSIAAVDYKLQPYLKQAPQQSKEAIDDAWQKTELLIKEVKKEAAGRNAELVIAYVPARWEVGEEEKAAFLAQNNLTTKDVNMDAFRERLMEISERAKVRLIDPTEKFTREEAKGKELYQSFVHFTNDGDKLFSEALYDGVNFKNSSQARN